MAQQPAFIHPQAVIKGKVHIGEGSVLHPLAQLVAEEGGEIIIGENVIIEECAIIKCSPNNLCVIGSNSIIQVGAIIENSNLGEGVVVEPKAHLSDQCKVGKGSFIAPLVRLINVTVPEYSCAWGSPPSIGPVEKEIADEQLLIHEKHLQVLRETFSV